MFALLDGLLPMLSFGAAFAGSERMDAGLSSSRLTAYELFVHGYQELPWEDVYLRPGVRFGYESLPGDSESIPVHLEERGGRIGAELGILYSGIVVPTLTLQGFGLVRTVEVQKPSEVSLRSSRLNSTDWLFGTSLAFSLGIPIHDGRVVVEPFYRWVHMADDARLTSAVGFDVSVAIQLTSTDQP